MIMLGATAWNQAAQSHHQDNFEGGTMRGRSGRSQRPVQTGDWQYVIIGWCEPDSARSSSTLTRGHCPAMRPVSPSPHA